jgi:dUTP pyrophosphatase
MSNTNNVVEPADESAFTVGTEIFTTCEPTNGTGLCIFDESPKRCLFQTSLLVRKLADDAKLPTRATEYDAGYDLYAQCGGTIESRDRAIVGTGISIRMPDTVMSFYSPDTESFDCKVYGSIRSRSGLSAKYGVEVGAGVIDFAYDKEVCVILHNHGREPFVYNKGDRIAQLVLEMHTTPSVVEVFEFDPLDNNSRVGGFGSSGN